MRITARLAVAGALVGSLVCLSTMAGEAAPKRRYSLDDIRITWRTAPPQAALERVPVHLKAALVDSPSRKCPPAAALAKVTPADGPWLASQYRRQKRPAQVAGLAWCLVYAGEPQASPLLHSTIKGEQWKEFDGLDRIVLKQIVLALGLSAQTNDVAYRTLEQLTRPEWWRRHSSVAQTNCIPSEEVVIGGLVRSAYLAIGLSGRPEARRFIQEAKGETRAASDVQAQDHSSKDCREELMLAECYLTVFDSVGRAQFREHLFDSVFEQWCVGWGRTEAGRLLLRWAYPPEQFKEEWEQIDDFFAFHSCPRSL